MTRPRPNGAPPAWRELPPDTPYVCGGKYVGKVVPGRHGGTITACATPSRERPRRGQYWQGLPVAGIGRPIAKTTAGRKIRDAGKPRETTPVDQVARGAANAERRGHVPAPIGVEFPTIRGTSRCSPSHRLWAEYPGAVAEASERAAIEVSEDASEEEFEAATARALETHPRGQEWARTEQACVEGFRHRQLRRRAKAEFSTHREAAHKRRDAIARGEDVTDAHYRDTLRGGEGSRRTRRRNSAWSNDAGYVVMVRGKVAQSFAHSRDALAYAKQSGGTAHRRLFEDSADGGRYVVGKPIRNGSKPRAASRKPRGHKAGCRCVVCGRKSRSRGNLGTRHSPARVTLRKKKPRAVAPNGGRRFEMRLTAHESERWRSSEAFRARVDRKARRRLGKRGDTLLVLSAGGKPVRNYRVR